MRKLIFFFSVALLFGALLACQDQGIAPGSNGVFTKSSLSTFSTKSVYSDSVISAPPDSVISAPPDSTEVEHHRHRREHHRHSW